MRAARIGLQRLPLLVYGRPRRGWPLRGGPGAVRDHARGAQFLRPAVGGHGDRHARAVGQLSPDLLSGRPHQLGDEAVQDLGGCLLSRLVVVSNRVSAAKQTRPGAEGGLSVAVRAALRERGGTWCGRSGRGPAKEYGGTTRTATTK